MPELWQPQDDVVAEVKSKLRYATRMTTGIEVEEPCPEDPTSPEAARWWAQRDLRKRREARAAFGQFDLEHTDEPS